MHDEPTTYVDWTLGDGVATITLRHPAKPNPLDLALQQQLLQALREVESESGARAILLRAQGRAFCVGADLAEMEAASKTEPSLGEWTANWMAEWLNPISLAMHE